MDTTEYLRGMKDCADGVPHKSGSEDYNNGYATQYQAEQNANDMELSNVTH